MSTTSRFELDPVPAAVRLARSAVQSDPLLADLAQETKRDVTLIVSELLSNAVAASAAGTSPVVVEILRDGSSVTIVVSNSGPLELDEGTFMIPTADHVQGRGLGIVATLSREVEMTNAAGTTTVRAVIDTGSG